MLLYNSLTNKKEPFIPIEANKVKMYVCGPTVYNYVHIGNARPVIFFDVVRRYFEYLGYEVTYVSNITDVDDKIINAAIRENVPETEIAKKYTEAFLSQVAMLNCGHYDHNPKVTEYMDEIIDFIARLIEKGYAYEVDGDVYFRVTKLDNYGRLSNQATEQLEIGARITDHHKKENPLDFTLWKKTNQGIKWASPWGEGRPGWHTECVAMINDTLGAKIDIHGGGADLMFPHHENEIAQSEALNHSSLANYWLHNGRLLIDNEKMSKSLGNFVLLKDFLENYDPMVLRILMLLTHYRQPINYTEELVQLAQNEANKYLQALKTLKHKLQYHGVNLNEKVQNTPSVEVIIQAFKAAMDDDFNTPNAFTALQTLIKEANKSVRKQSFTPEELEDLLLYYQTLECLLDVLGIAFAIEDLTDEDKELIRLRDEARKNKDFQLADQYREKLMNRGINI